MRRRLLFLVLLPAAVMLGGAVPFPPLQLFPTSPAVNPQRGFAIALDGEWLAIGARFEDVGLATKAGTVHLFQYEDASGIWKERPKVVSKVPQEGGQFGFAIALQGKTLAVSAIGEGEVHIFTESGGVWTWQTSLTAPGEAGFGRSVSVDGTLLAVGSGDPHGLTAGTVHVYSGASWTEQPALTGNPDQPEERFGHAVSLRGSALAVGAPGADDAKGAVYLFDVVDGAWQRTLTFNDPALGKGDQFGFAVATDGQDVVVGAPTAGSDNSGAGWVYRRGEGLTRLPGNGGPGGQLGHAVAIDGDRIAVGAPFEDELLGTVHLFTREAGVWKAMATPIQADSADPYDLSGFSVALSEEWLMFGKPIGDHGGAAAGSVSSFRCLASCESKGEVTVKGEALDETFGVSVAADGDLFAVGARRRDEANGSVTVFRKAKEGWRQEKRLSLMEGRVDEFGAVVAVHQDPIHGDLLVIGEPLGILPGPGGFSDVGGSVYLYRQKGRDWELEERLFPPDPDQLDEFGRSVATNGTNVVVGAAGAAYVFEKIKDKWSPGIPLEIPADQVKPGDEFGFAVAIRGNTIAVGAPLAKGHKGEVHVFERDTTNGWTWKISLASGSNEKEQMGFSIALEQVEKDDYVLIAGAPYFDISPGDDAGAVYVAEGSGAAWPAPQKLPVAPGATHLLGFAVSMRGDDLVVGSPGPGPDVLGNDIDGVLVVRRSEDGWVLEDKVDAADLAYYNAFGAAVAVGEGFFVATSPGVESIGLEGPAAPRGGRRDDRVTLYELP